MVGRLGLTLVMLLAAGISPQMASAQQAPLSFDELRDQGTLYFRKKRFKQAFRALKAAAKKPRGKEDYKTQFYLARTAAKLLLLEEAFLKCEESLKLAGSNESRKNEVNAFRAELDSKYGGIRLTPAKGETNRKGRIFLEAKTGIINKKKKEVFQTIRKRFRETEIQIPTIIYLPHGQFLANNVPVTIKPNELSEVALYLQVERTAAGPTGPNWWWIGSGIAATLATGIVTYIAVQDPIVEDRLKVRIEKPEPTTGME
ncbi:MAG: hypothetical protein ACPGQS_08465 [Bradymonadia bacterium]